MGIRLERQVAYRFCVLVQYVDKRVVAGSLSIATLTIGEEQEVVSHHFGDMALVALLIFPGTTLQPTFHIYLGTLGEDTLGNIGQATPTHNIVPLGDFNALVVATAAVFGSCQRERSFLHGCRAFGWECHHIRILTYITYKDNFVYSSHNLINVDIRHKYWIAKILKNAKMAK